MRHLPLLHGVPTRRRQSLQSFTVGGRNEGAVLISAGVTAEEPVLHSGGHAEAVRVPATALPEGSVRKPVVGHEPPDLRHDIGCGVSGWQWHQGQVRQAPAACPACASQADRAAAQHVPPAGAGPVPCPFFACLSAAASEAPRGGMPWRTFPVRHPEPQYPEFSAGVSSLGSPHPPRRRSGRAARPPVRSLAAPSARFPHLRPWPASCRMRRHAAGTSCRNRARR